MDLLDLLVFRLLLIQLDLLCFSKEKFKIMWKLSVLLIACLGSVSILPDTQNLEQILTIFLYHFRFIENKRPRLRL